MRHQPDPIIRTVNGNHVVLAHEPVEVQRYDEDGSPYHEVTGYSPYIEVTTPAGVIYGTDLLDDTAAGHALMDGLTGDFNPAKHPAFSHVRNMYGSDAWTEGDEVALMDDEERQALGH